MEKVDGEWYMHGLDWDDPQRIRSCDELVKWVEEIGFLPFFSNEVEGFSAEDRVSPNYWWSGIKQEDPWEWRELIAAGHKVAYGKFFAKKAGFISSKWLPYFANYRRDGYDFDSRWQDGRASRREKLLMDYYMEEDENGDIIWKDDEILSTNLKKMAGFGKGGQKNYPGIVTSLQMNLYLVTADFRRRVNKRGEEYGMPVSIMFPPEKIWGYDNVTSAYDETPEQSWRRIFDRVRKFFPDATDADIIKVIGKCPAPQ